MVFFAKKPRKPAGRNRQRSPAAPSAGPSAFSYYAQRSEPQPPRSAKRQSFRDTVSADKASRAAHYWMQRFGALLAVLVVVISLINLLLVTPNPRVMTEATDNTKFLRDRSVYQTAAARLFAASLFNRNKVTIDTTSIAQDLKQQFPELADVSITLPLVGHRPVVYIEPTQPVLIMTTTSDQPYVIDENGRALASVSQVKDLDSFHLATLRDESGLTVHYGKLTLSSDTVAFIRSFQFQLSQAQLEIANMVLPAGKSELDIFISGQPYFIKCNIETDTAVEQAGSFLAVRSSLARQGITPSQYVDVRVEGRAYYK